MTASRALVRKLAAAETKMTMADAPPPETRARAGATAEDAPLGLRVVAVRITPDAAHRRTPYALVDAELGPAVLTFTVLGLRKQKIEAVPPQAGDGTAGVTFAGEMGAAVLALVAQAAASHPIAGPMLRNRRDGR
jgi:hypothetical protein